jgi:hypothetical protein
MSLCLAAFIVFNCLQMRFEIEDFFERLRKKVSPALNTPAARPLDSQY